MKFSELDLHSSLMAAIEKAGFTDCTPVQAATVPHILEGRDVAGLAQTGTGKTAAFLLPLMDRILYAQANREQLSDEEKAKADKRAFQDWKPRQFILVLVPTRELAEQVYENVEKFKGESGLRAVSIYGGVSYDRQKAGLRDGVEFVVATPGRLIDLYKEHLVDLKQVRGIVFDEADRMFDMGFKDDMKYILSRIPNTRQFMVFSATLNLDVMNVAYQFGANPVEVDVSRDQAKAENVEDQIFHVGQEEKGSYLLSVLSKHKPRQTIVFSNFKMNVPRIAQFLNDNGFPAVGISSLLTQSQRNRVMEQFKSDSDKNILVATDVAARGLDIKGVDMVVNFELPDDAENYVHRIGRTGRAGAKGHAFSLVSDRDVDALQRVEEYLRHKVETGWLDETEIIKDYKPFLRESESRGERPRAYGGGGGGRPDRGPRRDGGRGDRGPRRDGGRGDGGRGDRGPRPERNSERGPRDSGGRPGPSARSGEGGGAQRGDRNGRPQQHRSQQGGGRPSQGGQGQRHAGRGPNGARPQQQHAKSGGGQQQRSKHSQHKGKSQQRPPTSGPGVAKKISGFFKRLFGG